MRSNWKEVPVSVNKILRYLDKASESSWRNGKTWYQRASRKALFIARDVFMSHEQVSGVIAALSPGCSWERNMLEARAMVSGDDSIKYTTYGPNVTKAREIVAGAHPLEVLGGNKVLSFYKLFMDPSDPYTVVVDRHAVRAACAFSFESDIQASNFLRSQYQRCADAYREAASKYNILPHQAQAIVWEHFRKSHERRWGVEQS